MDERSSRKRDRRDAPRGGGDSRDVTEDVPERPRTGAKRRRGPKGQEGTKKKRRRAREGRKRQREHQEEREGEGDSRTDQRRHAPVRETAEERPLKRQLRKKPG